MARQHRRDLQVFQSREFIFQAKAVAQVQQVTRESMAYLCNGLPTPAHLAAGSGCQTTHHAQQTGFARAVVAFDLHGLASTERETLRRKQGATTALAAECNDLELAHTQNVPAKVTTWAPVLILKRATPALRPVLMPPMSSDRMPRSFKASMAWYSNK